MTTVYDVVIKNGIVALAHGIVKTNIAIKNGGIACFGIDFNGKKIDARNLIILLGGVDIHTQLDIISWEVFHLIILSQVQALLFMEKQLLLRFCNELKLF